MAATGVFRGCGATLAFSRNWTEESECGSLRRLGAGSRGCWGRNGLGSGQEQAFRGQQSKEERIRATRWKTGFVRSVLQAPEESPIVSSHTHALGRSASVDSAGSAVPLRFFWPWPPIADLPTERSLGPRGFGHAQIMCPGFVRSAEGRDRVLRVHLPRPLIPASPPPTIPAFGVTVKELQLVLGAGGLVLLAVLNKILFKMAIASMPNQPFVLANICTLGYVFNHHAPSEAAIVSKCSPYVWKFPTNANLGPLVHQPGII